MSSPVVHATMMNQAKLHALSQDALDFYRDNGYLHLAGRVPAALLDSLQQPVERWVDTRIREWKQEGRIQSDFGDYPFTTRLMHAWQAAGCPPHSPNPTVELLGPEMYGCLRFPGFIDIAKDLFQSNNIRASGVFHCRPNLPEQDFTDTPWHQDAQCCPTLAGTKFVIMWIPLVDVDEHNGCLEMAPGLHKGPLYRSWKHPVGHYISMRPDDVSKLRDTRPIKMKRGDLLCFNELIPHRAIPNHSQGIRWAVDIRYSESSYVNGISMQRAFICAHDDPAQVENSYEKWCLRMQDKIVD